MQDKKLLHDFSWIFSSKFSNKWCIHLIKYLAYKIYKNVLSELLKKKKKKTIIDPNFRVEGGGSAGSMRAYKGDKAY